MTEGLVAEGLACRRGGRLVYRDVTLGVPPGGAAELRGPNGVGKSTLLRQLAGLVPVTAGNARLDGLSLARDPGGFQEWVAYAGHLDAVKPALTVAENLRVWAGLLGAAEARAEAALERFGLARLLLTDRPLWLLDEPTVSLDREGAALVAAVIAEHRAGGGIVVVATHVDLGLADPQVLEMTPPARGPEAETDPFLAGAWS